MQLPAPLHNEAQPARRALPEPVGSIRLPHLQTRNRIIHRIARTINQVVHTAATANFLPVGF